LAMRARPSLPDDIKELMALVRAGRLFDVQQWVAKGRRTVPPEPYWFSPLRVAADIHSINFANGAIMRKAASWRFSFRQLSMRPPDSSQPQIISDHRSSDHNNQIGQIENS